ncbi:MAG: terpene cyclase/mutase family protein, partial [Planctomycetota bacterium]|nr:terpene cyclase/mutase family protein [Planctomycetota bacterium]
MRPTPWLLLLATVAFAQDPAPPPAKPIGDLLRGKVVAVRGDTLTIHYDFEDAAQLEDFVAVAPDGLFAKGVEGEPRIEKGRLVLSGRIALRHRLASVTSAQARFTMRMTAPGDAGHLWLAPGQSDRYVFTTLNDRTFHKQGGLLLGAVGVRDDSVDPKEAVLVWRDIASVKPDGVAKHAVHEKDTSIGVRKNGALETVRVGGLWRAGNSEKRSLPMPEIQFGVWVRNAAAEFDDLTLTITPRAQEGVVLAPSRNASLLETKDAVLLKLVKAAPLSKQAERSLKELTQRGPKAWKKLATLAGSIGRKKPYAVLPIIAALAAGGEPERYELIAGLSRKLKSSDVRLAIARALAPAYPAHKKLLHTALTTPAKGRVDLLRMLAWRGLEGKTLGQLYGDPDLAAEAYQVAKAMGTTMKASVETLARRLAPDGHSRRSALAFAQDFASDPDWGLATALSKLLADKDRRVAKGAYLLLLTISDKDIAPDFDLWRSWISAKRATYKSPGAGDAGPVAAAILRARAYIRKDLLEDSACVWPTSPDWPATRVGATALAIYALKAAGLASSDKAIQQALTETVIPAGAMRGDIEGYTYALSMIAMALEAVDRAGYKTIKEALARKLVVGQLDNGQWTYNCHDKTYARRPRGGDNSNTQFAILGLRSIRRCGIKLETAVFEKTAKYFLNSRNSYGGWGYGPAGTFHHEMSMTAAGISTLAICAEGIHGPKALREVKTNKGVGAGQTRLGELLLNDGYKDQEIYTLYGVERACILTGTRSFNDFDWYKVGAEILVRSQRDDGTWGDKTVRGMDTGRGYGVAVDTCFALLFLKRSTTGL